MTPAAIIEKKRDGEALRADEISAFVRGFTDGDIPDYQMSALAMAIYFRGMSTAETAALTDAMLHSGATLRWPTSGTAKVDKHSTGGVGDKVSLVLAPLLACCGLQVPMISGRGLGPTGGTLDKLEAIAGVRTDLTNDEILRHTEQVGCVITGATTDIAPADRKLYPLRDMTATVASIPLITASIMSKKLAERLDALVLDVKTGSGAFMRSADDARALANSLVATGERLGVKTAALVTDMNQPLGRMVGNTVEVNEAVDTLGGEGPDDLLQLVIALGSELLGLVGIASSDADAESILDGHLRSGRALDKFRQMIAAQGGNLDVPRPVAQENVVQAERSGHIARIDTRALGYAVIELGGGRRAAGDRIDHSVGLEMLVHLGDAVQAGQPIARLFAKPTDAQRMEAKLRNAIQIGQQPPPARPLIHQRIDAKDTP